jgi:hypothetical protein
VQLQGGHLEATDEQHNRKRSAIRCLGIRNYGVDLAIPTNTIADLDPAALRKELERPSSGVVFGRDHGATQEHAPCRSEHNMEHATGKARHLVEVTVV